jgi:CRISPR-associated exonuclease Cas4
MRYAKVVTPSQMQLMELVKPFIKEQFTLVFEAPVVSRTLGLWGKVDAVALTKSESIPVEVKLETSPEKLKKMALHHIVQVIAYAVAVEETFKLPAKRALIVSVEGGTAFEFSVSPALRELVYRLSKELWRVVEEEKIPRPTPVKKRCSACFYRKFCSRL